MSNFSYNCTINILNTYLITVQVWRKSSVSAFQADGPCANHGTCIITSIYNTTTTTILILIKFLKQTLK
jgi:hypothetical protein